MTYNEFIQNILDTRGRFGIPKGEYKERHHIIPKCIGGTDEEDNLIDLYAREHFEAHKLLMLENYGNYKLANAFSNMAFKKSNTTDRALSPEEYEEARLLYANSLKGVKRPESIKDKLRANAVINDNYGMKNKNLSKEAKLKISAANSGDNNPSKLLKSRIKISNSSKRIVINRGYDEEIQIKEEELNSYIEKGWSLGFCKKHKDNMKITKKDGRKPRNTKVVIDYDTLYEKYVVKQMTTNDIAKEYNCSCSVVSRYLKLYNLSLQWLEK